MPLLPRLTLFEFHDQPWCPAILQQSVTDCVTTAWLLTGLWRNTVPHLAELLRRTPNTRLVDLCSGSGGPLLRAGEQLAQEFPELSITLTDLFPKPEALGHVPPSLRGRIEYLIDPVDALDVPKTLQGVRTMFGAFHHFSPPEAVRLIKSASDALQPIAIFEFQRRSLWNNLVPPLGLVGLAPFAAIFLMPFQLWRLLLTLLMVIPALWVWDSFVSILRTYTPAELAQLATQASVPGYRFEIREARSLGRRRMTCLLGFPDPRGGIEIISY